MKGIHTDSAVPKANNSRTVHASGPDSEARQLLEWDRGAVWRLETSHDLWWYDTGMGGDLLENAYIFELAPLFPITCWASYQPPQPEANGKGSCWCSPHKLPTQEKSRAKKGDNGFWKVEREISSVAHSPGKQNLSWDPKENHPYLGERKGIEGLVYKLHMWFLSPKIQLQEQESLLHL